MSRAHAVRVTGITEPVHESGADVVPFLLSSIRPILMVILFLSTPCGALAREGSAASPARDLFDAFHAQIITASADSRLAPEAAVRADELRLDLERELIRIDAEIKILRLDVGHSSGVRQQQAIDQLITEVAQREKRIYDQIQRLEALAGMPACLPAESGEGTSEDQAPQMKLTWEPEDFVEPDQP